MKIKYLIFSCCCAMLLFNCEEEKLRSIAIDDGIAPGMIQNVTVENIAGGAKLSYSLPNDIDLLYVEAQFKRQATAEISKVRSSIFDNSLIVEGFGEEKDYEVTLYAVDEAENRSKPVTVIITPDRAPIQFVGDSLEALPDFGGLLLSWENPFEGNISLEVSVINELGQPEVAETIYSSSREGVQAVRGFDAIEYTFLVIVKDRYDNVLETKTFMLTPLFEELVEKVNYEAVTQIHDTPPFNIRWPVSDIYDNNLIGNSGYHSGNGWIDPDGELPEYDGQNVHMITLDLGVKVKLSRIKWFQRTVAANNIFANGNPRIYDIWGTTQLNADGSLDGWTKVVDNAELIKPSGLPLGSINEDDIAAATAGHDAIADPTAPAVRYIRFVNKENWGGETFFHIMELEAWGSIID